MRDPEIREAIVGVVAVIVGVAVYWLMLGMLTT